MIETLHATRLANFAKVRAAKGDSDATDGILDRWESDGDSEQFLLVQNQGSVLWYATFNGLQALEDYATDESVEGWMPVAVIDLDTCEVLGFRARPMVAVGVFLGERTPFGEAVAT